MASNKTVKPAARPKGGRHWRRNTVDVQTHAGKLHAIKKFRDRYASNEEYLAAFQDIYKKIPSELRADVLTELLRYDSWAWLMHWQFSTRQHSSPRFSLPELMIGRRRQRQWMRSIVFSDAYWMLCAHGYVHMKGLDPNRAAMCLGTTVLWLEQAQLLYSGMLGNPHDLAASMLLERALDRVPASGVRV